MRYLPQTKKTREEMLEAIGASSISDLFKDVPPEAIVDKYVDLPMHMGELEVERYLAAYANENKSAADVAFFLGAGIYHHHIPASVDYIIQRSEYLTAYTPYQPEIAQGTLAAIYEYQTFIALLTGQEVSNASLYDGATATAEAALMALRVNKKKNKVCVANDLHPDYRAVLNTYMGNHEDTEVFDGEPDEQTACVIIQSPDFYGKPHAYEEWRKKCDETGALLIVVINEIISLGLLPAPESADIVCGEARSVGVPMSFGGPHCGFFACKEKYVRQMPGRLIGQTLDQQGKRSFVLTLNTREQHIRREKATSNICTNQGLCALAFTVHMGLLGEDGFKKLARLNHEAACRLADKLSTVDGVTILTEEFFNEFTISLPRASEEIVLKLSNKDIIAGYALDNNQLLVATTELTTENDMDVFVTALKEEL